jgi:hypothetical protein
MDVCTESGGEAGDKGVRSGGGQSKRVISRASKVSLVPTNYCNSELDLIALVILSHGRILQPHTESGIGR